MVITPHYGNFTKICCLLFKELTSELMNTNDFRELLKKYIASGEEDFAVEEMLKVAAAQSEELEDRIYLISNKYKKLKTDIETGSITRENANVFNAQINRILLNIIDEIEYVPPEQLAQLERQIQEDKQEENTLVSPHESHDTAAPTPGLRKRKLTAMIPLVVVGLLLILLSLFVFTDFFSSSERHWIGTWQHEIDDEGVPIGGTVTFEMIDDTLSGTATFEYPVRGTAEVDMYHINSTENSKGRKITGSWQSDLTPIGTGGKPFGGTFEFELGPDNRTFEGEGKESFQIGNSSIFSWQGKRID